MEFLKRFNFSFFINRHIINFLFDLKDSLNVSLQKLIQILNIWTQLFPYDFRNQKMMKNYRTVTDKCLNMDLNLKENIIEITQGLLINASFSFV